MTRKTYLFVRGNQLKSTLELHSRDNLVLVYVSHFRNSSGHFFNLILENKSDVQKYQLAHIDDSDLQRTLSIARSYNFCLSLHYSYHLPREHSVKHIVVYTKGQYRDCSNVKFHQDQSIQQVAQNFRNMSTAGYVGTGISSFQNYQGLHYMSTFRKLASTVTAQYVTTKSNLEYRIRRKVKKNMVPFFIDGTYDGTLGVGPQAYSLFCFQSKHKVRKEDVLVLDYPVKQTGFTVSDVYSDVDAASKSDMALVPVSTMVWFAKPRANTNSPRMRLVILLLSSNLLKEFDTDM